MKLKFKKQMLILFLASQLSSVLFCSEVDKGFVIMDEDPWKVSWLQQEDKTWVLKVLFERGAMQTHFIEGPPSKGLGLSPTNKPDRQELILDGKTFTSTDCQFEQWPDGAKGYSFRYEAKVLQRDGPVVEVGTTAIIEEVGGLPDKMRYCLYKVIEGDR